MAIVEEGRQPLVPKTIISPTGCRSEQDQRLGCPGILSGNGPHATFPIDARAFASRRVCLGTLPPGIYDPTCARWSEATCGRSIAGCLSGSERRPSGAVNQFDCKFWGLEMGMHDKLNVTLSRWDILFSRSFHCAGPQPNPIGNRATSQTCGGASGGRAR
jgi:hypothetical protein